MLNMSETLRIFEYKKESTDPLKQKIQPVEAGFQFRGTYWTRTSEKNHP